MQVNVGKSRTGRLTVADGDDPIELASRFAMIYHLNASAAVRTRLAGTREQAASHIFVCLLPLLQALLAEAIQANMDRHRIRTSSKAHLTDLSSIGTQSEMDMLDLSAYVQMVRRAQRETPCSAFHRVTDGCWSGHAS